MATYLQFLNAHRRGARPKRVYWICGDVHRLVEEVVDLVRNRIDPDPWDLVRFHAGEAPDRDIWAALNQFPAAPGRRLVQVRDAERIQRWDPLSGWLDARELSGSHALFVSGEPKTDTSRSHVRLIVRRGRYVRCGPFWPPEWGKPDRRIEVLKAHGPITDSAARLLVERTRGRMDDALDFMNKCKLFSGVVDERVVKALVEVAPADDFVDSLITFKPREAFQALRNLPEEDYSRVIGLLDYRLDCLFRINLALRKTDHITSRRERYKQVLMRTRLRPFVVHELIGLARRYDHRRGLLCLEALAMADSKIAEGERDLVMELLVSIWCV